METKKTQHFNQHNLNNLQLSDIMVDCTTNFSRVMVCLQLFELSDDSSVFETELFENFDKNKLIYQTECFR